MCFILPIDRTGSYLLLNTRYNNSNTLNTILFSLKRWFIEIKKFPYFYFVAIVFPILWARSDPSPKPSALNIKYLQLPRLSFVILHHYYYHYIYKKSGPKRHQEQTILYLLGSRAHVCKTWKPCCCLKLLGQRQHFS